eukprot:TRINITY_DN1067_c0_g1_i1.p1 TRINITY_DN1067_c0_g1~~TRINITY_DN1067_c0_g1_i1.p1  ORF type:complete len:268 (-),score=51.07 TRINITY_DN1067_c0_g1_i1:192-995(-)
MEGLLAESHGIFEKYKAAEAKGNWDAVGSLLTELKLKLTEMPALPPFCQESPTALQELTFAREVLESAVLYSVKREDEIAFERNVLQLKTYYTDTRHLLPPSPQEYVIQGLNLLRLLVQNRIAEFHTELELFPQQVLAEPCIRHAVELEQALMEGAYRRVLAARQTVPHPSFIYFMDQLMQTVRDEIASCSEKAYESLTVKDAKHLLGLDDDMEFKEYAEKHEWTIVSDEVLFQRSQPEAIAPRKEIPSMKLISQTLGYARELERIV